LLIVPFPESSLNDEAGKNFMESYDEYARRAKLLAGVHGLKGWSTPSECSAEGKSEENSEEEDGKQPAVTASILPNALGKNGSRSNIVKSGATDKKMSKKKSLKRL
jgi:ubiquitin-conjugating enzyme E2 S